LLFDARLLHCALSLAAQCIVIGPVCVFATGGRAGGQPARAQCLRLSERFFHLFCRVTELHSQKKLNEPLKQHLRQPALTELESHYFVH